MATTTARYVIEDVRVRKFLEKELYSAQVSKIEINRYVGRLIVNCYVVRLGIAVGKGGARREELRQEDRQAGAEREGHPPRFLRRDQA